MQFDIITFIGLLGGALYLASHFMRGMVPLRVLSLCSNVALIVYSVFHLHFDLAQLAVLPEFLLNVILLPMNAKRLVEILRLTKQIENVTERSPMSEWLLPHMHLHKHHAGHVLFREGDPGDKLYVLLEGKVRISRQVPGMGEEALAVLRAGTHFGEMALIDDFPRSADARAHEACKLFVVRKEDMEDLLFVDRDLAYDLLWSFVRTLSSRLRETNDKMTFMAVTSKF